MFTVEELGMRIDTGESPHRLFGGVDDDFWLWLNTEGYRRYPDLQKVLPSMPDKGIQTKFVGSAGDSALKEGFDAYRLCKRAFDQNVGEFGTCRGVLDFGCGWGRMIRFFLKDLEPEKLWGIDCRADIIDICKQTNKWCRFELGNVLPPTPFAQNMFDLIYCYSVFSHLSEEVHRKWLVEFHRILRPGGLVIATTWHREFISLCDELRKDESLSCEPEWRVALGSAFLNTQECLADYDGGKFVFAEYDRQRFPFAFVGEVPCYGEACIPKLYVLNNWTRHFRFVDFIDDREQCPQNAIIMMK